MKTINAKSLSAFFVLCLSGGSFALDEIGVASHQGKLRQYDISLQPGQHLIIVNTPERRVIRVDTEEPETLRVGVKARQALPFVHLKIAKPILPQRQPDQRISAL